MVRDGFDSDELAEWRRTMGMNAQAFAQKQKAFLRKEGSKLSRKTRQEARVVHRIKGNYYLSIKRGKVWKKDGATQIRAYSNVPHGHLIEMGHKQTVNPGKGRGNGRGVVPGAGIGREVGSVEAHHVFEKAGQAFAPIFEADCAQYVDDLIGDL